MAVVIRLARFGAVHTPKYRVTVADSRYCKEGRFIEVVGHYNPKPHGKEVGLKLDVEKVNNWVKKGAKPTERVQKLIELAGQAATAQA